MLFKVEIIRTITYETTINAVDLTWAQGRIRRLNYNEKHNTDNDLCDLAHESQIVSDGYKARIIQ